MSKTVALVTGASSGIGEAFCRVLAGRCERIIAVARRAERLQALAEELAPEVDVVPVVADLTTLEGVTRTMEALRQRGPVQYLVNNAGFSTYGPFAASQIDRELQMVRLHVDASISLCRAALPFMVEAGSGYIVNVASLGAFLGMPRTAVYGACKAFLSSFSQSLQVEVAKQGVRVQCLCPGFTRTEIHDTPDFAGFDKGRIPRELWMDSRAVVEASLAALERDSVLVVPGATNQAMAREGLQQQMELIQ
jgi:short-subunit dehydrogenase